MTKLVDRLPLSLRACFAGSSVVSCQLSVAERELSRQQLTTDHGPRTSRSLSRRPSRGLTLIEMLVALAITLVMMAAVVNLFANMSASIRNRRAAIETGSQLRQVRNRLAMDLAGATCRGSTWQRSEYDQGYIEIIEGEWSDKNPSAQIIPANLTTANGIDPSISLVPSSQAVDTSTGAVTDGKALGDWDDVLALTVRSESDPFVAQVGGNLVESPLAEVVWLAREQGPSAPSDPNDGMRRIYRRVLLIAPWLGPFGNDPTIAPENVSAHWDQSLNRWVANTLGDLTKRENRATRRGSSVFPHFWDPHSVAGDANHKPGDGVYNYNRILPGNASIDALVLSNALAFDVRVFDPTAPLIDNAGTVVGTADAGFDAARWVPATTVGEGDYVDLNYRASYGKYVGDYNTGFVALPTTKYSMFSELPQIKSQLQTPLGSVYDTWSYHYENDGIDQDNNGIIDQGANGLDDDNANGVDDPGERETAPPYDVPLRGVKVILRVYEPDSRQIRESSVTHSFKQ